MNSLITKLSKFFCEGLGLIVEFLFNLQKEGKRNEI